MSESLQRKKAIIGSYEKNGIKKDIYEGDKVISEAEQNIRKRWWAKKMAREASVRFRGKYYVNCAKGPIEKIELSLSYMGHLAQLSINTSFHIGPKRGYKLMKGNKDMSFGDIMRELKLKKDAAKSLIDKLSEPEINVLYVSCQEATDQNIYELNPEFFHRGSSPVSKEESLQYVKLYFKKFNELTKHLKAKEKGLLLKLIPFFHVHQYCLCANPEEWLSSEIQYFDIKGLSIATGIEYKTMSRNIKLLKEHGVVGEFDTSGILALYVHPDLVFSKDPFLEDKNYTNSIRELFIRNAKFRQARSEG